MIVTAHQPNFLPGASVLDKVAVSDAVIWLDEVQYTKGGYTNRNRVGDAWLTVPVERHCAYKPINRVRIGERDDWRRKVVSTLAQRYGLGHPVPRVIEELERPYRLLVGLNVALLHLVCSGGAGWIDARYPHDRGPRWAFQSHLDGGHAVRAVSEDAAELLPISDRLAMMVEELGGEEYLSGPSGRRYLDESPFHERGIHVRYFEWTGERRDNVNALEAMMRKEMVA